MLLEIPRTNTNICDRDMHSWWKYARNSGNKTFHAWSCRFSSSRCSLKTRRLICRTASKPSLPRFAFWLNLSMLASSTLFLIFCHPPQSAVILASWLKSVEEEGTDRDGLYTTVSRTLRTLDHVRLVEHIVSFFETGSTYDTSYTWEVASPPKSERTHLGTDWLQVIRRSVRSYIVANRISHISHTEHSERTIELEWNRWRLTTPVDESTDLDNVSTATTCVDLSFHGQYLRQFAVETSSQE